MRSRIQLVALLALTASVRVEAQRAPDLAPYLMANRTAEVSLARSAAPRNVSDSATVLVLTRTGFVEAARGTNGFSCMVLRSFSGKIGDEGFWVPSTKAPQCFNTVAVRTVLPVLLKRVEWLMAGVSTDEVTKRTAAAYASHAFPTPAPGAMAYMLSSRQHLSDSDPRWMPHLMIYNDRTMTPAMWGAGGDGAPIMDATGGDRNAPVQLLLIPVRRWSDGTPATITPGH